MPRLDFTKMSWRFKKSESLSNEIEVQWDSMLKIKFEGPLGGLVGWVSDFNSGHDLTVRKFEPHNWLCADRLGHGACFEFCVSLSCSLSLSDSHSVSLSLKNESILKKIIIIRLLKTKYQKIDSKLIFWKWEMSKGKKCVNLVVKIQTSVKRYMCVLLCVSCWISM